LNVTILEMILNISVAIRKLDSSVGIKILVLKFPMSKL